MIDVVQEADGGYCAECLSETWEQLRKNVPEAITAFFFDSVAPQRIRLHPIRDEVVSIA